jgi:glycolate oxidase iron-sulfur subunit
MQSRRDAIYQKSLDCVHCGLCLPTCPTYRETGRETSSPRGRIYLMRGLAEGKIPMADPLAEEAYLCLGCRACETACPSGVEFGSMLELLRAEVEEAGLRRGWAKRIETFALREILPRRALLAGLVSLLAVAQQLGLDRWLTPLLPAALRKAQASLPTVPARSERRRAPGVTPARGERRGSVAFFEGGLMPELFGPVNAATLRVLARHGVEVRSPAGQGCCGALHAHAGDDAFARDLARRNVAAFAAESVDAVVVNSAGCGAAMRDAAEWLPNEGEDFAAGVRDICEWLDSEGLSAPLGSIDATVCYDDPCHLVHGQRVQQAPRRLLSAIPGLTVVAHDDASACCGAAGIYSLTHPEMSNAVLDRKLDALQAADPDIIATGNPGCLMQLRAGAATRGMRARVVHPIELIDEAQSLAE